MSITKNNSRMMDPIVSTGSTTARALSDRFADVVNVKDFGAVGDGVTDDQPAIQAAVDSGVTKIVFQGTTYRLGKRITPVSNQSWIGETGLTMLKLTDDADPSSSVVELNKDGSEGSLDNFSAKGHNLTNACFLSADCGLAIRTPLKLLLFVAFNLIQP